MLLCGPVHLLEDRVFVADDLGLQPALLADPRPGQLGLGIDEPRRRREAVDRLGQPDKPVEFQPVIVLELVELGVDRVEMPLADSVVAPLTRGPSVR